MALQEMWTAEIREVYARAAFENVDLSMAVEEKASGTGEELAGAEEVSREEMLNRQVRLLSPCLPARLTTTPAAILPHTLDAEE